MATYKVLQDIEAEDKLVGPLTLRQCIYAGVSFFCLWLSYLCVIHNAAFMVVIFLPVIGTGFFFAFPWNRQQSTEVWALAKVRFMLKPRKRIWDQSGMKHLVDVIAPQVMQDPRRHPMSQNEVQSRLKALAATVDSRGWAVKNVPLGMYTGGDGTDRLTAASAVQTNLIDFNETSNDDMFDLDKNPIAQQFDAKITAATQQHRQQVMARMANPDAAQQTATQSQQQWYTGGQSTAPGYTPTSAPAVASPAPYGAGVPHAAEPTAAEVAFAEELKHRQDMLYAPDPAVPQMPSIAPTQTGTPAGIAPMAPMPTGAGQMPTLPAQQSQPSYAAPAASHQLPTPMAPAPGTPTYQQPTQPIASPTPAQPVTTPVNPAILELANNNDLNVATIAREAKHIAEDGQDEVVISLH